MTAGDWIALAQGIFLAVAAGFAWSTYRLAQIQNGREPRRRLLSDAVAELKGLALESERRDPQVRTKPLDVIAGHQRRLAVALAFMPWAAAHRAKELTRREPKDVDKDSIEFAAADLNYALRALDAGLLDDGAYLPMGDGDRPPIRPRRRGIGGLRDSIRVWRFRARERRGQLRD